VLLVEDNEVNQMVAQEMLEKLGCEVEIAGNGREAIEASSLHAYDIIFMDCQMPEVDGFDATRAIRAREALGVKREAPEFGDERYASRDTSDAAKSPDASRQTLHASRATLRVPIVALTANAMKEDVARCLDCGMDDHVPKPVTRAALDAALKKWCAPQADQGQEQEIDRVLAAPSPVSAPVDVRPSPFSTSDPGHTGDETSALAFDAAGALARTDGDQVLLTRMIDLLIQRIPEDMAKIRQAVTAGEAVGLRQHAHKLKGSLQQICATTALATAKTLELLGQEGTLDSAPTVAADLERQMVALTAALEMWKGQV
jgi:CheY-like chemotaxis protein